MDTLNDSDIRQPLIDKLNSLSPKPKAILEELRVHNGNAIADVVTLHRGAHCYEIKGDNDKVERVIKQAKYYDLAFRKLTLVTTRRHLKKALSVTPEHWGIILAEEVSGRIIFKYERSAQINAGFDKRVALLTLWKEEMLDMMSTHVGYKSKSRDVLAGLISNTKKKEELSESICSTLLSRYESSVA
ncbi:MAG: sce7726 family protein [Candidatus Reddybacter sp.]